MWSDNETAVDLLGYQHLVSGVTTIVRDESLSPATVGVFGDWGGGKSSLLRMVESELAKDENTLVISFNGWLFEGYEDAKSALMGVILDEIAEQRSPTGKAAELAKKLLARVNWFRVAGSVAKHATAFALLGPAGIGLTAGSDVLGYFSQAKDKLGEAVKDGDLQDLAEYLRDDTAREARKAIRDFRDDFADLLTETNTSRLVVLIDDLDRCLPPVVVEILEAIKLFLFVDKTAFVIGADERLVQYAVRRRFPEMPGEVSQVANEYLEKLIQYPVRIPPLDSSEMETYINLLFAEKADLPKDKYKAIRDGVLEAPAEAFMEVRFNAGIAQEVLGTVPPALKSQLAMSQRIAPVLATGLKGNPRQCKRFLNTLVMRQSMAASRSLELEQRLLSKLMLLEYLHPEWFRRLSELQAEAGGTPNSIAELERRIREEDTAEYQIPAKSRKSTKKKPKGKSANEKESEEPPEQVVKIDLPKDLEAWLTDEWMSNWLQSEPQLADVDLRPYFYFSRDRLGSLAGAASRMTPAAQKVLQELFHASDAQKIVGLRDRAKTDTEEAAPLDENEFSATEVSLFSGGLDSFIGSIERLAAGEHLYLVGHHGAGTTNKAQVDAFESISKHYEKQACSLRFYVQPPMPEGEAEKTTRSRSILFLALGHAVAASAEKALPLHVPENGLISLNPPLTSSRLGTLSTRTTHPHFMDLFRTLLAALGSDVEVVTPYRFETKGEMALRAFSNPAFASAVHRTVSCSHPDVGRYQGESPGQHCGYCVPCIIRRAALYAAGLDDPAHYLNDIVSTRPSAGSDTNRDLRAFEMAVARFDEADLSRHLFDVLSTGPIPPEHADEFAAVYRRGMTEVKNFLQTLART